MHSRIYQISKEPIDKADYIEESQYYDHWFLSSVADYVNGTTDRESDIQWLKECYQNMGIDFGADNNGQYLIIVDVRKYFQSKFDKFQNLLQELSEVTIDDFADGKCGMQMYCLKEAYEDKFGFYVDMDGEYLRTFDDFVRSENAGIKFYIGATIDYHF